MASDEDFAEFWALYPRHTAKFTARAAFDKARLLATQSEILDGIRRYVLLKPAYADWCIPATFLNQGRWLDEPDSVPAVTSTPKTAGNRAALSHFAARR